MEKIDINVEGQVLYVLKMAQMNKKGDLYYSIKFGYTKNFKKRYQQYKGYHQTVIILHVYPGGTEEDEKIVKHYLNKYALFGDEWFKYCSEVLEFFDTNDTYEKLKNTIDTIPDRPNRVRKYFEVDNNWISYLIQKYHPEVMGDIIKYHKKHEGLLRGLRMYSRDNQIKFLRTLYPDLNEEELLSYKEKEMDLDKIPEEVLKNVDKFNTLRSSRKKLYFLLDYTSKSKEEDINFFLDLIQSKYKDYYNIVGPEIIRSCSCIEAEVKKEWLRIKSNDKAKEDVIKEIYKTFQIGNRYTKVEIKETLKDLYQKLGYQKTAKATDLNLLFMTKPILTPDKKHGVEILGRK